MSIRVIATDLDTGIQRVSVIEAGNYCIVAADPCHVAGEQHHATGTTVITLKGRAAHLMGMADIEAGDPS